MAELSDKVLVLCVFSQLSEIRRLDMAELSDKVLVLCVFSLGLIVFTVNLVKSGGSHGLT